MVASFTVESLTDPIFSAADVVRATGVSTSILQQWCNREIVMFSPLKIGERTFRRFSMLDTLTIAVMHSLRRLGINPLEAKELSSDARAGMGQRLLYESETAASQRAKPVPTGRYLMVFSEDRGHGGCMFFAEDNPVGNMSNYCTAALLIDLDAVAQRVMANLEEKELRRDDADHA